MEKILIENMADILEVETTELTLATEFKQDKFDWDSLKGYAILVMLEEEFGVNMPVDDFIEAKTVGEIFSYARENKA